MEEQVPIEKWLDSHKGEGVICLRNRIEVNFPSGCRGCKEQVKNIKNVMTNLFGGATVWDGTGTWVDDSGEVVEEPVKILTSAHNCMDEKSREIFANALKEAGEKTGQFALGIRGTNKYFVIPTGKLKIE